MLTLIRAKLLHPRWRRGLAMLLGALTVFTYAPFYQSWLMPILLAGWLILLAHEQAPKPAFWNGFFFGFGWFAAGISWVYVSIDQFGGLPFLLSVFIMALLCAYLALFPALAAALWLKIRARARAAALLFFPLIWLVTEFLRGWLLTGFPWLGLGYSQTGSILGNFAPHIGEVGITVILWASAIGLAYTWLRRRLEWLLIPALCLVVAVSADRLNPMQLTGETTHVALVQGNVVQELKWNPDEQWPNFHTYLDLTEPFLDHDLIIWPESAITFIEPMAQPQLSDLDAYLRENQTTLISGIIDMDRRSGEFFNSMIVLGEQSGGHWYYGHANRYSKHQLLPIGEFVPFEQVLRPLAPLFDLPMSSFSRGPFIQENLDANGLMIAANICYEVVFSRQIRANVNARTDMLLTISNDTWFGNSHGPHQHMEIARMRARELGRPMLRATNNGITGIYNEQGVRIVQVPQFEAAVASARVAHVTGTTFFSRFGEGPAWLLSLLLFFCARPQIISRSNASKA